MYNTGITVIIVHSPRPLWIVDSKPLRFTENYHGAVRGGGGGGGRGGGRRVQCGIIYCLSRGDCEKVAEELNELFRGSPITLVVK